MGRWGDGGAGEDKGAEGAGGAGGAGEAEEAGEDKGENIAKFPYQFPNDK
ncbi:MAG: hypothetical protein F6K31_18960 [Symploca sp. SIO2G7]|nr:hypothetical protein [Symploca sp. SIO2G7]